MLDLEITSQVRHKFIHGVFEAFLGKLTFPDHYDVPAESFKGGHIGSVTLLVPADLFFPELDIGTWFPVTGLSRMAVPETTVDEYHRLILFEHQIRLTRKSL